MPLKAARWNVQHEELMDEGLIESDQTNGLALIR